MTPRPTQHELPHEPYEKLIHNPIQQLLLIAPLLIVYHVGTYFYADTLKVPHYLRMLFESWHAPMAFLPSFLILTTLTIQHFLRKDRFCFSPGIQCGMIVEGAILWLPLLPASWISTQFTAATVSPSSTSLTMARCVESIGAGVYEEFIFRAVLMSLLGLLLIDILHYRKLRAKILAVAVSAILFSLMHFQMAEIFGNLPLDFSRLLFLAAAGVWFAVIYLWRGYGVAVATHLTWNIVTAIAASMVEAPRNL